MAIHLVTRHLGAVEWARAAGVAVNGQIAHLDIGAIASGDVVIGILPVNLAAEVCARRGARSARRMAAIALSGLT